MSRALLLLAIISVAAAFGVAGRDKSDAVSGSDALMHYWDQTDLTDTAAVGSRGPVQKLFPAYAVLLAGADSTAAMSSVRQLLDKASALPAIYRGVLDIAEQHLYDPASPAVDEECYLPFLKCALADTLIYPADRLRMEQWLTQIYRNRRGTVAADFSYIGRDGAEHTLSATAPGTAHRLLVFYDPDCPHCLDAIEALQANASVTAAVASGSLALIAIYADGDPDIWERSHDRLSDIWTVGYSPDGAIENDEIYDLRAMPTLYLLSGNVVELKDMNPQRIPDLIIP